MINKDNINIFAKVLNFKDYGTELYILKMLGARFINEQYPSHQLIKTYYNFFRTDNKYYISDKKIKEIHDDFYESINSQIIIKKSSNHKTEITEKVIHNLEKFRDEVIECDTFIFKKYSVICTAIRSVREIEYKPWKEYVQFLDKVNEYIKDKDLSDKELLGIYTKQIPMEIETIQPEILGSSHDSNLNSDFGE